MGENYKQDFLQKKKKGGVSIGQKSPYWEGFYVYKALGISYLSFEGMD